MLEHADNEGMISLMPAFMPEDAETAALLELDHASAPAEDRILADPELQDPMRA